MPKKESPHLHTHLNGLLFHGICSVLVGDLEDIPNFPFISIAPINKNVLGAVTTTSYVFDSLGLQTYWFHPPNLCIHGQHELL